MPAGILPPHILVKSIAPGMDEGSVDSADSAADEVFGTSQLFTIS